MSRFYPERIPENRSRDPKYAAECKVFDALKGSLKGDYSVFANVKWILRDPRERARDGEADFVVAHPGRGFLVLEVKGGRISYEARTGKWSSKDREGKDHPIDNPFEQAMENKHRLLRKLRELEDLRGERIEPAHGVVFPDSRRVAGDLGFDAPREIVSYHEDVGNLAVRIERMFEYWRGRDPLGLTASTRLVPALHRILARSWELPNPLVAPTHGEPERFAELTESQFWVLDSLAGNRRALVRGSSGTGKTFLALEKAKRLARDEGFSTWLTCFNRPLGYFLKSQAKAIPNLTVSYLHQLCHQWANRAGLAELIDPDKTERSNENYGPQLVEKFVSALGILEDRFDAIVVDEGQDFGGNARAAVELALADREDSVLYVFQDPSQAIYNDAGGWPEQGFATFTLRENCRNTQRIQSVLASMCGDSKTRAQGPPGRKPELIEAAGVAAQKIALEATLDRLIRKDGWSAGNIAVLCSSRRLLTPFLTEDRLGNFPVKKAGEPGSDHVTFDSISRFKGLECDVAVLTGLSDVHYLNYERLLVVGAGRGRSHLIVIEAQEVIARFLDPRS